VFYYLASEPDDHILVIAPTNAFMSWEDELKEYVELKAKRKGHGKPCP
jgi:hypothetical protein